MTVIRISLLMMLASLVLSACAYSVETLKKDDKLRKYVLADCVSKGLAAKDSKNCINAAKAQAELSGESILKILK